MFFIETRDQMTRLIGGNTDWLVEGLAQAADGHCVGYRNADVLLALTAGRDWIPLATAELARVEASGCG